jgi:hypothetical protein
MMANGCWQQFKHATLFFSKDSASVAAIIPAMDLLTDGLNPSSKSAYNPGIMAALKLARKKMDCYYSLTDSSHVYRIAMVLHPGMKLDYFRQHKWEAEWIDQAEDLVRQEYQTNYKGKAAPQGTSTAPAEHSEFFDFGNLSVAAATPPCELDDYLRLPVENVADPLVWWRNNRTTYLNLSRMALDHLSIPGKCPDPDHEHAVHVAQQHQPLLSGFFLKVVFCFHSRAIDSRDRQSVHISASDLGSAKG